jgi:hypothetical protein
MWIPSFPDAEHRACLLVSMDNFYLQPLPHAVGVIPAMCTHEDTVALRVHETLSWTGDNYTIDNALTGEPVLRVKGHVTSIHGRKGRCNAALWTWPRGLSTRRMGQISQTRREHLSSSYGTSCSHFVVRSLRAPRAPGSRCSRSSRTTSP